MQDENLSAVNQLFLNKLNTPEGAAKIMAEGSIFIRTKLREQSFARQIVQPQYVTSKDLQRSVNHDGLVKIVDIEPDSKAMVVNFRGNPTTNYLVGERFEIPFFKVESETFQKTETELLAYEMPFTEIIERNSVLDIQKIEDTAFLSHCDAAIDIETSNGHTTLISGTYDTSVTGSEGMIKRSDLKRLFDILDGNELKCEMLLMDTTMFNRLALYPATSAGDAVVSEVMVNGYTYATLMGKKVVVSNKVSLLKNKIYAFTAQEYFGQFLVLGDVKFWIEKKKDIITFSAYELIGMGIGNTKSVAKLVLS